MLITWAHKHGISQRAYAELLQIMGIGEPPVIDTNPDVTTEAGVQQYRRIRAAKHGGRLWRNNSGAFFDDTQRMVRYGLGNDSKEINRIFKSSDLIGITPVTCHCGQTYGVFTAEECKPPGWKLRPADKRAKAQLAFIQLVLKLGGIGRFITSAED